MKSQVPAELISAYFDGEASPEERAEVERLLAGNDDLRRELNETAQLSALLHSFPRESAPIDLAANVLQQTNQIPLPPSAAKPATAVAKSQNVWRDWKAGFAGAAITSAAMCLILVLNSKQTVEHAGISAERRPTVELGSTPVSFGASKSGDAIASTTDHALPAPEAFEERLRRSDVDPKKDLAEYAKQAVPAPAPITMSGGRGALSEQEALESSATPAVVDSTVDAPTMQAALTDGTGFGLSGSGQSNDDFLKGLQQGKVFVLSPQPADPDSNVAVVYFVVVDIVQSAEKLQVYLQRNSIEPRSVNNDSRPMPDDDVMIYTVASGDQLAKTVKDFEQHRELISNWTAQAPIQLATTNEEAPTAVQEKTLAARNAAVDKSSKAVEPNAATEADTDTPEVQAVIGAYATRNGFVNPAITNSISNSNTQFGSNRAGFEMQKQQQLVNSAGEKKAELSQRSRNSVAGQPQANQVNRAETGYDYVRLNNSLTMSNGIAAGQSIANQMNPLRMESNRAQVSLGNSRRLAANDANSRALRMLFVLHPQSAGAQVPASPAPAKGQ